MNHDVEAAIRNEVNAMAKVIPGHFQAVIAGACQAAGVTPSKKLVQSLRVLSMGGKSHHNATKGGFMGRNDWELLPKSTYSDNLEAMRLEGFQSYVNDYLAARDNQMLREHVPDDGKAYIILDGHYKESAGEPLRPDGDEYVAPSKPSKRRMASADADIIDNVELDDIVNRHSDRQQLSFPTRRRASYLKAIHGKANNYYDNGTDFATCAIAWKSNGEWYVNLLGINWLAGFNDDVPKHVKFALALCGKVDVPVTAILMDRWYDSKQGRRLIREAGIVPVVRLKLATNRRMVKLKDGTMIDLNAEWRLTGSMQDIKPTVYEYRGKTGKMCRGLSRSRLLEVDLDGDGEFLPVMMRAAGPVDGHGDFKLDSDHCFAVVGDPSWSVEECAEVFGIRWEIEVWLNIAAQNMPKPRAKNLKADVIQFYVYLIRIFLGTLQKFRLMLHGSENRVWDGYVRDIPVDELSSYLIGHRETFADPD